MKLCNRVLVSNLKAQWNRKREISLQTRLLLISWSFPLKLAVGPVFLVIQTLPSLDNVISNQTYLSNLIDPQVLGLLISDDFAFHGTSVYFLWIIREISSTESALSPNLKCKHSTLESKFHILLSSLFK